MNPMLANLWKGQDPTGWYMSEKLDGIRALWLDYGGDWVLTSRYGNRIYAPEWFLNQLPKVELDGELWIDRGMFQQTSSVVRRHVPDEGWKVISFCVFDLPGLTGCNFQKRLNAMRQQLTGKVFNFLEQQICEGRDHLQTKFQDVLRFGGEGLMLKHPQSYYVQKRSSQMLKVKQRENAEATVIGYQDGNGKHLGRCGALIVQNAEKRVFELGTGLTDNDREEPPLIGQKVRYQFTQLTDAGLPRFPVFKGVIL